MTPLQQLQQVASPGLQRSPSVSGIGINREARRFTKTLGQLDLDPTHSQRTIRIALAGCGVVGGGLVRLLHESASAVASRFGIRFVITSVLVRDTKRERHVPIESHLFTDDLDFFLAQDADVVIEAVGGEEPARTIAVSALRRGRQLITANKDLIATHGDALDELANLYNTGLDFGAAVGGSVPVISTLRDLVGASAPRSVRGILNGTSNFVISQLEHGTTLESALDLACAHGLAESDCSRDLDGSDAAAKLAIIAWIAFGIKPAALELRRISLLPGLAQLTRFALDRGGRLRFIAECTQLEGDEVVASVEPVIVNSATAFARTTLEENYVEVDLGWTSPLSVSGPGAGGEPTAAALLGDLVRVAAPPPPNGRGPAAIQFTSVRESADHCWVIGARVDAAILAAGADAIGLAATAPAVEGDCAFIITGPATWERSQRLLAHLETLGTAPFVARYEIDEREEDLQ
jgi:homoserine dehydrogenase